MKTEIVYLNKNWGELTTYMSLDTVNESGAVALAKVVKNGRLLRFLVRELVIPTDADYLERSPDQISFTPEFMESNFQRCEANGLHLVNIHSHPFSKRGSFSFIDKREGSNTKGPYVQKWVPNTEQAFMVVGSDPERLDACFWSLSEHRLMPVVVVKIM